MRTDPWSLETQHDAIRTIIGHALKSRYELPTEVPHQMLALLLQLREQDDMTGSTTAHRRNNNSHISTAERSKGTR